MLPLATSHDTAEVRTVTGRIFDIQRFSIHDGPGIRTTVFLKGCPLNCLWCHNPEGRRAAPDLGFSPSLCIGCGFCLRNCPARAHESIGSEHRLDRDRCIRCFRCVQECYSGALERIGRDETVEAILCEVLKDRPFYEASGGGMTLSGGEPLAQPDFALALLRAAKDAAIHTCIETCGAVPEDRLGPVIPYVDLFLYDYKETDPGLHRRFTGHDSALILRNLHRLDVSGAAIVLRCPLIPGLNLRDDHLDGIVRLARGLRHCREVQLMGYHRLGNSKAERLGLFPPDDPLAHTPGMTAQEVDAIAARLRTRLTIPVTAG